MKKTNRESNVINNHQITIRLITNGFNNSNNNHNNNNLALTHLKEEGSKNKPDKGEWINFLPMQ